MNFILGDQVRVLGVDSTECRSMRASNLIRDIPTNVKRFFRAEVLNRWTDLSPEDVTTLNADRDELISFLQQRYGFADRRAASEADNFIAHLQNRVRLAQEISGHTNSQLNAA